MTTTEQKRLDILAVATAEFADAGFSGARIDAIAARTATSKRMIYYHFGSKEGLYRAVMERVYDGIRSAEEAADLDRLPPMEALAHIVALTFDYHHDHPELVRLVMNENIQRGAQIGRIETARNDRVIPMMQRLIDRGVAAGVFRPGLDPVHLHMSISALAFFHVSNRYTFGTIFGQEMVAPEAIAQRRAIAIEMIARYCRP